MFNFFEGLIEKLGVKSIVDFTDRLYNWIKNIKDNSNKENNDNGQDSAQIGSSGYYAKIGSSGDSAQIGSSGYYAKIGSSGDYAQIGSSGDSAQIGSSGYYAQIGSSGDSAQIGSSGDYAQIDISGLNSIGFACGYKSKIKAKKGTWISLAEYGRNEEDNIVPIFAKSAQIGNKEYRDAKGKILKSSAYYILWEKEFYEVDEFDGIETIKISEKKKEGMKIIKALPLNNLLDKELKEIYIAVEGKLSAHAYSLREAVEDLTFKKMKDIDVSDIVARIKETGKVTRSQYRAITGACSFGTQQFCERNNIQDLEEIELTELRKILINDYGAEKFWKLIDEE